MNKTKKDEYTNISEQGNMAKEKYKQNTTQKPITQEKQNISNKPFKSSYINDSGKWSIKAVDDGYVDFDDYINDIKDESAKYPSYNSKNFRVSDYDVKHMDDEYEEKISRQDGYTINETQKQEYAAYNKWNELIWTAQDKASYVIDKADETVKEKYNETKNFVENAQRASWYVFRLGGPASYKAYNYAKNSEISAFAKATELGLDHASDNKADAYRHFLWNALMTRDKTIGYYQARNVTNRYEYENMRDYGWLADDCGKFDYKKDNTIIKGKMNQANLMDLWNNQVGRELANNKDFKDKTPGDLFEYAIEHDLLITDATRAYEFLGILNYITDYNSCTVDVEWNLATGNITVKKDDKSVTLKMGI